MKTQSDRGFTLAELLIVVAIIGVLVAIAIPVFTSHLEKSRQSVDLSSERNAYGAARIKWMTEDEGKAVTYYYNGSEVVDSSAGIQGYGKSTNNASEFSDEIDATVTGIPKKDDTPNYLTVNVDATGVISMAWGTSYGSKWAAITSKTISGNWYAVQSGGAKQLTNESVKNSNSSEDRKAADIDLLNSIADYFNGMDASEAAKMFSGNGYNNSKGSGQRLFEYCVDKNYSVRLNPDAVASNTDYFNDVGYSPKIYNGEETDSYKTGTNNYVDTYLFTSDEVIAPSGSGKGVKIKFTEKDGKITNAIVWMDGTDLKSNL